MAGIERHEFIHRDVGQFGGHLDIDMLRGGDGGEIGFIGNLAQHQAKMCRIADDVLDREQLGHIVARLARHPEVRVIGRFVMLAIVGLRARHAIFAPIVGGQSQFPVAELVMQFLQIIQCAIGRADDVATAVVPPVLLHAEVLAGGGDELPDAGSAGDRIGARVECAFDHRQQCDLGRHAAAIHFFHDVEQVALRTFAHAQDVIRMAGIPLLMALDQRAVEVLHGEAATDAFPQITRGRFGRDDHGFAYRSGCLGIWID